MPTTNTTAKDIFCPRCAKHYDITAVLTLCECGAPLLVDYDYEKASSVIDREKLKGRTANMWRYLEVLPVFDCDNVATLGEGGTQLLVSKTIGPELGMPDLFLKDETTNPTGSFKARGLAMAVSRARELGLKKLIIPTAGNAGSALAAYAARAGLECKIIMPRDVPGPFLVDAKYHGAQIELVDGTIKDCGERATDLVKNEGWFSAATLKEPYRIEGKKTMGYELAEDFNFELPDVIIYPTGGGTGLIGMWKAFDEMERMGWIGSFRPKMVSVQAEGCAPIPRAYEEGLDYAPVWEDPHTLAAGLRVPGAVGDFLMLEAVRKSGGTAVAVSDNDLMMDTKELSAKEGIFSSPEGGATLTCLKMLLNDGFVKPDERVVLFITGSGYKYLDVMQEWDEEHSA
ncbi:MAG TPA: threonine synthase [candidate division Zixibacteria bacterium]|nr:threonine synthase [candidate division Zixibacteria bacterium]HEQ98467.1 threonine synthase [candidate division Zixibacteria bacterium]